MQLAMPSVKASFARGVDVMSRYEPLPNKAIVPIPVTTNGENSDFTIEKQQIA